MALFTWKCGRRLRDATANVFRDHKPKKSDRNFTVTGMSMSCLDRARTANLGTENLRRKIIQVHHWFTTQASTLTMFGLDRDSQLNNSPLPILWSLHELNVFARKNSGNLARMHSLNKHVEQVSFRQCVTFCKHRQLKGWQPHFQPTEAKSWICTTLRWFEADAM